MLNTIKKYYFLLFIILIISQCKKPYQPAAILAKNNYLVVDGFINTATNGITTITLSRTRNLSDTITNIPELQAHVTIESNAGATYPLNEQGNNGIYISSTLNLDTSQQYKLNISTYDGNKYASDFVSCKSTPPIDSVTWYQNNNVYIFVNTHDPANNTHYYRWKYIETWEYHSQYDAELGLRNDTILFRYDSTNEVHVCYSTDYSANILLGSSAALSQDVISNAPITEVIQNDDKIVVRYSILVQQYALTSDAYQYWQIIQKNTQQLGTLFDLQPSQLVGNIHSLSNASEPVIGFVSATATTEKRIFIDHSELTNWMYNNQEDYPCPMLTIDQDPNDFRIYHYADPTFVPLYYVNLGIVITKRECVDCTLRGGTRVKPGYW